MGMALLHFQTQWRLMHEEAGLNKPIMVHASYKTAQLPSIITSLYIRELAAS